MDKLITRSNKENIRIFCSSEYEAKQFRTRAREMNVNILPPVTFNSVHQGTKVILSKKAEKLIEEWLGVEIVSASK